MITRESVQEVLDRVSLIQLIGEWVALKRTGSGYQGLCPFHKEKSPSFHVREEEGYYHCFGCGESGDALKFLMEMKHLSFPEAVEELAARYGVVLKHTEGREQRRPQNPANDPEALYALHAAAQSFYSKALATAPTIVKEYLASRGLTPDAIARFGIGFAPAAFSELTQALRAAKCSDELMLSSGIIRRSAKGDLYDLLRGRLIFPIFIDPRRIAAFGGRIIPAFVTEAQKNETPKYINSPENPVYHKSKVLYGLPQAQAAVRESGTVFLVEGYMDVVGMSQAGVSNVVATCGTALTKEHAVKLGRLASKVVVLFDGDGAGRAAAGRAFEIFLNSGVDAEVRFLPEGEDPDSLAKSHGAKTKDILGTLPAKPLLICYLDSLLTRYQVESAAQLGSALKGSIATEVAKLLAKVENSVERGEYLDLASFHLRLEQQALRTLVEQSSEQRGINLGGEMAEPASAPFAEEDTALFEHPSFQDAVVVKSIARIDQLPKLDQQLLLSVMAVKEEFPQRVLTHSELCQKLHTNTLEFITELLKIMGEPETQHTSREPSPRKEKVRALLEQYGPTWRNHWLLADKMRSDKSVKYSELFDECVNSAKKSTLRTLVEKIDLTLRETSDEEVRLTLITKKMELARLLIAKAD